MRMFRECRIALFVLAFAFAMAGPPAALAKENGLLPVPRFVSLRSDEVNVRAGPGVRYPVKWVYQRRHMPVEVIAEYDTWRKVRDWEGSEGWVHRAMLSSKRALIITSDEVTLRRDPQKEAPAVARLSTGVVVRIEECPEAWCRVVVGGYDGWVPRTEGWGLYEGESLE